MIQTPRTQSGNTLAGLIIGLLLASVIIALLLWFLNQDKNIVSSPQQPITKEQKNTQPETIRPDTQSIESISSTEIIPNISSNEAINPEDNDKIGHLIHDIEKKEKTINNTPQQNKTNKQQNIESKKVEQILNNQGIAKSSTKNNQVIVQAGSFTQESQAKERQAQLILLNIPTTIIAATVKGNTVYRVQTAPTTTDTASKIKQLLVDNKIESLILNTK